MGGGEAAAPLSPRALGPSSQRPSPAGKTCCGGEVRERKTARVLARKWRDSLGQVLGGVCPTPSPPQRVVEVVPSSADTHSSLQTDPQGCLIRTGECFRKSQEIKAHHGYLSSQSCGLSPRGPEEPLGKGCGLLPGSASLAEDIRRELLSRLRCPPSPGLFWSPCLELGGRGLALDGAWLSPLRRGLPARPQYPTPAIGPVESVGAWSMGMEALPRTSASCTFAERLL